MKKLFFAVLTLALLLAVCTACAETYATHGSGSNPNGSDRYVFFVESSGNAKVQLSQSKGICTEISATKPMSGITGNAEEWGKYHINVTINNSTTRYEWAETFNNNSFTINLSKSGSYRIEIIPYTASELTKSYLLDKFVSWESAPVWYVSYYTNCYVHTSTSAVVTVYCKNQQNGSIISSEQVTLNNGTQVVNAKSISGYQISGSNYAYVTVNNGTATPNAVTFYYKPVAQNATVTVYYKDKQNGTTLDYDIYTLNNGSHTLSARTFSGYTLSGSSSAHVTVSNGKASPSTVTFYYQRKTSGSTVTTPPIYNNTEVIPAWVNTWQKEQQHPEYLTDGNTSTAYEYVLWSSEFQDNGHVELSFGFNSDEIRCINLWGGDQRSYERYTSYSRPREIRATIYTADGTYTETLRPSDNYGRQYLYFSRSYTDVYQIDLDILHIYSGDNKNFIRISEISFN